MLPNFKDLKRRGQLSQSLEDEDLNHRRSAEAIKTTRFLGQVRYPRIFPKGDSNIEQLKRKRAKKGDVEGAAEGNAATARSRSWT